MNTNDLEVKHASLAINTHQRQTTAAADKNLPDLIRAQMLVDEVM